MFVDPQLAITATDGDFVVANPQAEDTSCAVVQCEVVADPEQIISCSTQPRPGEGGYDVLVSLTKRIDYLSQDSYEFTLQTKVHWSGASFSYITHVLMPCDVTGSRRQMRRHN